MKILNVAYPFAPVSRDAVGGAEQVLNHVVEALVAAGHESIAIARADSKIPGKLLPIPIPNSPLNEEATRKSIHDFVRETIHQSIRVHAPDAIHFHGIDFHEYLPANLDVPTLVTLHLPPEWYPAKSLEPRPNLYFNCVSNEQAKFVPGEVAVIPNGVPIQQSRICPKKRNYIMCLGRICPEKGFHFALDAAASLKLPIVLAGEVFPYEAHQRYFRERIAPRLSDNRRFIGPIGCVRKRRLLAAARCLVVPSQVHETSSLVAMEALACGTPVVAFRRGALPGIVEPNRTGILVDNPSELPDAILAASRIDPAECRRIAIERFSCDAMTPKYLTLYQDLASANLTNRTAAPWPGATAVQTVS